MSDTKLSTVIDPDALKYMLSMPRGRAVLWDILSAAGLFRNSFNPDQRQTDFLLGNQNMGLLIYADCMAVSPEFTAIMIHEQGDYQNVQEPTSVQPSGRDGSSDDNGTSLGLGRLGPLTDLGGPGD